MSKKQKRSVDTEAQPMARLAKLRKAWAKASEAERAAFLEDLQCDRRLSPDPEGPVLIANGRYLLPRTVTLIERHMAARGILPEQVASELGFPDEGTALTRALAKGASLRLSIVSALTSWLAEQEQDLRRSKAGR
jgi:hypothetical protein